MKLKRATIKDVAKKAGVSISVVSYVLNDTPGQSIPQATRDKIFKAAEELKYTPNAIARGMRIKKSMAIGVVSFWSITDYAFNEILSGISKIADENNYTIVLCNLNSPGKDFNYAELFRGQQIDGIIFISPHELRKEFDEKTHIGYIKDNRIPAVIINGYTNDEALSYIFIDYYHSTYIATEHMAELGHKAIGYLLPDSAEMSMKQAGERYKGYMAALKDLGIIKDETLIFNMNTASKIVDKIAVGKGPTAIVANKTNYAQRFISLLIERGIKVPQDVSIIAANTEPYSHMLYPPLSTVKLPLSEIGEKGAEILMESVKGKVIQTKMKLPNKICERQSCMRIT